MHELLKVADLKKSFSVTAGLLSPRAMRLTAVNGVDFSIAKGETLGLVGESGCGKSTIARLVVALEIPDSGEVLFEGRNIFALSPSEKKMFRRRVQIIFQDPLSSLNPRKKAGSIVAEPLRVHSLLSGKQIQERVEELLDLVGLGQDRSDRYPHEFSSGQRQRIGIARALSLGPELVIADEPVSALDVSIQAQTINLLMDLQERLGLTYLFISHDLSVVRHVCSRVAVMYLGKIVEVGRRSELYTAPLHPYTEALLAAVPLPEPFHNRPRIQLQGEVPSPLSPPAGCIFSSRCPIIDKSVCFSAQPPLEEKRSGHWVACFIRD